MSLLRRAVGSDYIDPTKEIWSRRRGRSTTAGYIDPDKAQTLMAVWRCQHLLADIVSGLPIHQYRNNAEGDREQVESHEFVRSPSDHVRAKEWRYQLMLSALGCGNAYAYVTRLDSRGRVARAEVLEPADVLVRRRDGALAPVEYEINRRPVDASLILHMRAFGPMPGSVLGMSPLAYAAKSIRLGLGARDQMSKWHDKGGHPTALLQNANDIDQTIADVAKQRYRDALDGDDLLVLGGQWSLDAAQVTPTDAEFIATSNVSAIDVCGFYGVPPEMIGVAASGSSVTYANREQRALDLLVYTVQWWVDRVEQLISEQLQSTQFVKLNVDALLRSDARTRWEIHDRAIRVGARSPDEARRLEELGPIPGDAGNSFLWPPYATSPVTPTEPAPTEVPPS